MLGCEALPRAWPLSAFGLVQPVEVASRQSLALRLAIRPLWTSCRPLS